MDLFENTYSEEYRHECEVRFVAKMDLKGRRQYLGGVLEKRGVEAQQRLKDSLEEIWKTEKYTDYPF